MRFQIKLLLMTFLLMLWLGTAYADEFLEGMGNVSVEANLVFGNGGGRDLKLTIYYPAERQGPYPAVVFIHGGGWRGGQPGHFARQATYLAAHGYVCACIEYRLSGEAPFPAAIEDSKCAIRWMRGFATHKYKVDPERIAVSGGSAGGHLALLASTSGGVDELEGTGGWQEFSSRAQLVIAFNPVCEVVGKSNKWITAFLGGTREEVPGNYSKATPETYLDSTDPPMLLFHGTDDETVPYAESVDFVAACKAAGVEAELYTEEGRGHGWFNRGRYFEQTTLKLKDYLDKHLK